MSTALNQIVYMLQCQGVFVGYFPELEDARYFAAGCTSLTGGWSIITWSKAKAQQHGYVAVKLIR